MAAVFIEADNISILFEIAHDGAFLIVITIGNTLYGRTEHFLLVFLQVVEIALFQSFGFR